MLRPKSLGARLLDMGAALLLTGQCPECGLRVPCRNDMTAARHRLAGPPGQRGRANPALWCRGSGRQADFGHIDQCIPDWGKR